MTDEKLKCPTKDPGFVGQNVQRATKSFREAWIPITNDFDAEAPRLPVVLVKISFSSTTWHHKVGG